MKHIKWGERSVKDEVTPEHEEEGPGWAAMNARARQRQAKLMQQSAYLLRLSLLDVEGVKTPLITPPSESEPPPPPVLLSKAAVIPQSTATRAEKAGQVEKQQKDFPSERPCFQLCYACVLL